MKPEEVEAALREMDNHGRWPSCDPALFSGHVRAMQAELSRTRARLLKVSKSIRGPSQAKGEDE